MSPSGCLEKENGGANGEKGRPLKASVESRHTVGREPLRKSKEAQHVGEAKVQVKPREVTFS